MNALAVILLLAVSASALRPNSETIYQYDTQMVTGAPHHAKQFAGVRVNCRVRMVMSSRSTVTMKMDNVQAYTFEFNNEDHQSPLEPRMLSHAHMIPVNQSVVREIAEQLAKPVQFTYQDGRVDNVKFDPSESLATVNMKKGCIAKLILQLDQREADVYDLNEDFKAEFGDFKLRERSAIDQLDKEAIFYKTMETDPAGTCESVYSAWQQGSNMRLTKIRNLKKCINPPVFEQGLLSGLTITPEFLESYDAIEKDAESEYVVQGSPSSFTIKDVTQYTRYRFTPLSVEHGSAITTILQRMTLVSENQGQSYHISGIDRLVLKPKGLLYEFPSSRSGMMSEYVDEFRYEDDRSSEESRSDEGDMQIVEQLLDELIAKSEHQMQDSNVVEVARELAKRFKVLSVDQMMRIISQYVQSPSQTNKKGEVLLDLLPTLTTPKAVKVMAQLITQSKLTTMRSVMSLKMMAVTLSPNADLIKNTLRPSNQEFLSNPRVLENRSLKQTAYMLAGIMQQRWIKKIANERNMPIQDALNIIEENSAEIVHMYKQTQNLEDKQCLLKALSYTQTQSGQTLLTQVATHRNEDKQIRRVALFGLSKMVNFHKTIVKHTDKEVQKVILAVYSDMTENPHLRMCAFTALMDSRPTGHMIKMMINIQAREQSKQVGSYVYTYTTSLANAELPGFKALARNFTESMDVITPFPGSTITNSKAYHYDTYSKSSKVGYGMEFMKLNGDSVSPSTVVARVMMHRFKKTFPFLETGFYNKGLEGILYKLFSSYSGYGEDLYNKPLKDMIEDLLTPLQSGSIDLGSIAEEVKEIIDNLGIKDRQLMNKYNFGMWVTLFGNDMSLIHITSDDILEGIRTGKWPGIGRISDFVQELSQGKTLDFVRVLHTGCTSVTFPTITGLPVSLNFTAIAVARGTGQASLSSRALDDVLGYAIRGEHAEPSFRANVKLSTTWNWNITFGCQLYLLKNGITLKGEGNSYLPLAVEVKYNTQAMKLTTSFQITEEEAETLNTRVTPGVFSGWINPEQRVWNKKIFFTPCSYEKRIALVDVTIPSITIPALNMRLVQRYLSPNSLPQWMPVSWLWSKKKMVLLVSPIRRNTPVDIEMRLIAARKDIGQWKPEKMHLRSELSDGVTVGAEVYMGQRGGQKAGASINMVYSPGSWKSQMFAHVQLPTEQNFFKFDGMMDLKAIFPSYYQRLDNDQTVAEFSFKTANNHADIKFYPSPDHKLPWNSLTQNHFYKLLEQFTDEPIRARVVTPYTRESSTQNFRFVIDTNIQSEDISRAKVIVASVIATKLWDMMPQTPIPETYSWKVSENPGATIGQLSLQTFNQNAELIVRTTYGWQYAIHIPTYLYQPTQYLIATYPPVFKNVTRHLDSKFHKHFDIPFDSISDVCVVNPSEEEDSLDKVETFDGKVYDLSRLPSGCEVLLSKECTSYSRFTVLMKSHSNGDKVLKVLVPHHKIQIQSVSSWLSSNQEVKVEVDGSQVHLSDGETIELKEMGEKVFARVSKSGSIVTVKAPRAGISVRTNGKTVSLKSNPALSNKLCGICGNYNGETIDEFQGPDMHLRRNAPHMVSSYVIPSSSCDKPSMISALRLDEHLSDKCEPIERTLVKSKSGKTCFSAEPVLSCPSGCRPTGMRNTRDVAFVCKEKQHDKTHYLAERSRYAPLSSFESEEVDSSESVAIPTSCEPKY